MVKRKLLRWGTLCLMALVSCGAWAQSNIQEKELYSTDFTEWGDYETSCKEQETTVAWSTKYSHETLTFSIFNTQIGASNFNVGKFPDWTGGFLMANKSDNPYIITSPLKSVTKVHFMHGATGGNRGWKLWAKGDGDADWVLISDAVASTAVGTVVDAPVNKTNCQLKFTNITNNQNAYLMELAIYGNVDMSLYPALGSFSYNGETFTAADIFDEVSPGVNETTIKVAAADQMPSDGSITGVVIDNGEQQGNITYTPQEDGSVVASIVVVANGQTTTYNIHFVRKPYYTLTYYNTDGTVLDATQQVEEDAKIGTLRGADGVTVPEGMKFRGWFVKTYGGEKYTTDYTVTQDINLYAVATQEETGEEARYDFDLTDRYFYDEDHEAFNATGAEWHDTTHGWVLGKGDKIDLLVGGNASILVSVCRYGGQDAHLTLIGTDGQTEIATIDAYNGTDGHPEMIEYTGGAGTVSLVADGTAYIHRILVMNTGANPIAQNEQGYYVVNAGDGGHLLNTLDIVNALPADEGRVCIFLPDGTYDLGHEVLTEISRDNVSIIGQSIDGTKIVNETLEEGIGVSATFLVTADNTYFQDLTLQNAYDYYQPGYAGRAVVLQDKGNRTICKNVRMLSYQDTYYSNADGQYYFEDSDIHGTVDFICGSGDVFFKNCTLTVEPRNADGSGECTITAPYTEAVSKFGYVFDGCTVNCLAEKFNYGRAWGGVPRCAYLNTTLMQPDKLNANRWTLAGMNVAADKFVEYNTKDSEGKVVSPASCILTFTKDATKNEMETILTADEAAGYAIDKVFSDWTPAVEASQKMLGLLNDGGNSISWDAVDGVSTYAVFRDGKFVAMTSATSYGIAEGEASKYTVRAANACGGFGRPASTTFTGIGGVVAATDAVATAYYSIDGTRVSDAYRGLVIKVETMSDGSVKTTKVIK